MKWNRSKQVTVRCRRCCQSQFSTCTKIGTTVHTCSKFRSYSECAKSLYRWHTIVLSCLSVTLYNAHSSINMRTMPVAVLMHVLAVMRQPNIRLYLENATPMSVNRHACMCKLVSPYPYTMPVECIPKILEIIRDSPCQQNLQTHSSLPHSPQVFGGTGFAQACVGQVPPSGPKPWWFCIQHNMSTHTAYRMMHTCIHALRATSLNVYLLITHQRSDWFGEI